MSDKKFINGLIVKAPNDNAPDYLICKLSIKREELIQWLQQQTGEWINADIKESQGGKWYAAVDDWRPNQQRGGQQQRGQRQSPEQKYDQVREQRLRDHQRNTPVDDFGDDLPF